MMLAMSKKVKDMLLNERPDVVVHAAAYTNVDKAELETELAYQVNAMGAFISQRLANSSGPSLSMSVQIMCSMERRISPMRRRICTNPLNIYGHSKLLGEKFVTMTCSKHFIVRTSWLYGTKGTNFVTKVLEKARSNPTSFHCG